MVPLMVHSDDKLLSDFTGHESLDCLPAVATVTEYNNCMAWLATGTVAMQAGNAASVIHSKLDYCYYLLQSF